MLWRNLMLWIARLINTLCHKAFLSSAKIGRGTVWRNSMKSSNKRQSFWIKIWQMWKKKYWNEFKTFSNDLKEEMVTIKDLIARIRDWYHFSMKYNTGWVWKFTLRILSLAYSLETSCVNMIHKYDNRMKKIMIIKKRGGERAVN